MLGGEVVWREKAVKKLARKKEEVRWAGRLVGVEAGIFGGCRKEVRSADEMCGCGCRALLCSVHRSEAGTVGNAFTLVSTCSASIANGDVVQRPPEKVV
jgi:hypothetical protein